MRGRDRHEQGTALVDLDAILVMLRIGASAGDILASEPILGQGSAAA